jgi:ribose transport system ATP-binding protein
MLRLAGIQKRFPGAWALKGVDLEASRGEVHAIVGENGAGKSTLMAISAGSLAPDAGEVRIRGERLAHADPEHARELGLAIVYQESALVPDLTVAENTMLALPRRLRGTIRDRDAWLGGILAEWRAAGTLTPRSHARDLAPDARFIVEVARAMAEEPNVLVLDEPTEHLLPEDVERLFTKIRAIRDAGGTVIYISHRIREVKQIADRITVLRDGCVRGTFAAAEISEDDVVARIVGRDLTSRFPAKTDGIGRERLVSRGLRGGDVCDVDLVVHAGEIVGFAGIEGQGQREAMRALAGLVPCRGEVTLDGRPLRLSNSAAARGSGIEFVPNDRHHEGVLTPLSVRENLTVSSLASFARGGIINSGRERRLAEKERERFSIKAPDLEGRVDTLSGGNQQKVVLARALSTDPAVVLADEPTQGVDVGARAEIYKMLRNTADAGAGVVVISSDNAELEGLCDRVLVFSRGRVVDELSGGAVSEQAIANSVLTTTTGRRESHRPSRKDLLTALTRSDRAPAAVLLAVVAVLAGWATAVDGSYLSSVNITSVLTLFAALAFIAIGQQLVMLTGGIDLSVGPQVGVLIVVASFALADNRTPFGLFLGALIIVAVALAVGAANWALVSVARIQMMIATFVTYMVLQGVSLLLRPEPGGSISRSVAELAELGIGPIPLAALVVIAVGVLLELALGRAGFGWRLRAVGSNERAARQAGVHVGPMLLAAYVGCALFTLLGAVLVMAQVGLGDASNGLSYTFSSIAAVVLGGGSIFGGRGSFVGALAGALLVVQINSVAVFVHLDDAWNLYLLGGLTLAAAAFYSMARSSE